MPKSRFLWPVLVALFGAGCHHAKPLPFEVGMWYWNSPFQLSQDELKSLKQVGVKTLYVREATFTTDGHRLLTEFHEHWQSPTSGLKIVLVYNFDSGVIRHFRALDSQTLATDVADGIAQTEALVRSHGIQPTGIQLDLDCPTSLLPKYAQLVRDVRGKLSASGHLSREMSLSATALQTWLGSDGYGQLAAAADFLAPQFYESRTGQTVDKVAPIADIAHLAQRVDKADSFGKPFYVGLATYGHALLYDQSGKLAGMYHGLKPTDALRHPALRYDQNSALTDSGSAATSATFAGENVMKVKAVEEDMNGRGLGDTIAYVIPSPEMLSQQLAAVKAAQAAHCRGVILYRFPATDDELALPLCAAASVLDGGKPTPDLEADAQRRTVPWALIAGDTKSEVPLSYQVRVRNSGNAATLLDKDGCDLIVLFNGEGLEDVLPGDFDEATPGQFSPDGSFIPCARAHANAVLLRKYLLRPNQTARSGRIDPGLNGPKLAQLLWHAKTAGGFKTIQGQKDFDVRSRTGADKEIRS